MAKQQVSENKIIVSYVSSVFFAACLSGLLLFTMANYFIGENTDKNVESLVLGIVNLITVFVGVIYGARMAGKKYIIQTPDRVILSSIVYFAIVWALVFLPVSILGVEMFDAVESMPEQNLAAGINSFFGALSLIIFIVASRKYLKA